MLFKLQRPPERHCRTPYADSPRACGPTTRKISAGITANRRSAKKISSTSWSLHGGQDGVGEAPTVTRRTQKEGRREGLTRRESYPGRGSGRRHVFSLGQPIPKWRPRERRHRKGQARRRPSWMGRKREGHLPARHREEVAGPAGSPHSQKVRR
ncbi:hypothetical protein FKM82_018626 [Ascaphus truei]